MPLAASQNPVPQLREPPASLIQVWSSQSTSMICQPTQLVSQRCEMFLFCNVIQLPSAGIKSSIIKAATVTSVNLHASTLSYRKRKEEQEKTSLVPTKRYKARMGPSQCSKCQEERTAATGHKQYFGNWFCPTTSMESYE